MENVEKLKPGKKISFDVPKKVNTPVNVKKAVSVEGISAPLTNIGTSFGMGLIITTFMMGIKPLTGAGFVLPAIIGNVGAIVGSIVSTRLMLRQTSKVYGREQWAISIPITALGAAGAAIGLAPNMVNAGLIGGNDIAVCTAMCMCWSGYLSTHMAMMDSLKCRKLTGKAIIFHTIGGICAGIAANWLYKLVMLII